MSGGPGGGPDLDLMVATAAAAADAAGRVIRPLFRRPDLAVSDKADRSPVTRADREAEAAMRAVIAALQPDHAVFGEEAGAGAGTAAPPSRYCWMLDPIDGTRAFLTGRPTFGTLVALLEDGVPIVGVIDQPVTGERWTGARGRPTRFEGGLGGRIGTRACASLAEAELSATTPAMFDAQERPRFEALAAGVRRTSWGGDCYAYGLLALGLIDIVAEADLRPWDWSALVPVIEGAGGTVTDWNGEPLAVPPDAPDRPCRVLALGDRRLLGPATAILGSTECSPATFNSV